MLKIGITGAYGLVGWHMRCRLFTEDDVLAIPAGRAEFLDLNELDDFVRQCDAIVHLAGMNRGDDAELERINVDLAARLIASIERVGGNPHVVFASSTHIDRGTPYGRSKLAVTEAFQRWADQHDSKFTTLVLPHVFGEHGRPHYNSVVSTFCSQLARGECPRIVNDIQLELLHAQEVAELALSTIRNGTTGELRPSGYRIDVSGMLARTTQMAACYTEGTIPAFDNLFDLRLFNTYRSYLFPDHYPRPLELHSDDRGALFEAVRTDNGGQAFLSTTKPGVTRGEHFHCNKIERFLVLQGEAVIRLRRLFDHRVIEFPVDGIHPAFVDMPTLHTHNITNVGSGELLTFFWSHEVFDPHNPDTYKEAVVED